MKRFFYQNPVPDHLLSNQSPADIGIAIEQEKKLTKISLNHQTVTNGSNDIANIFVKDIWKIILQYTEDNYTEDNSTIFEQYNHYSLRDSSHHVHQFMDVRQIIIKDPFFLSITAPGFFQQFILSSQIVMPMEPTQAQINIARCQAMKKYLDGILENYKTYCHKLSSRSSLTADLKCYALSLFIYNVSSALFLYLMVGGVQCFLDTPKSDDSNPCVQQFFFGFLFVVLSLSMTRFEVQNRCKGSRASLFSCVNPFKEKSGHELYQEQIHTCSIFDALLKLKGKEAAVKICDDFAGFLGLSSGAIRKSTLHHIMEEVMLKYNSHISEKEKPYDTPLPDVKIEVLDNNEITYLSHGVG